MRNRLAELMILRDQLAAALDACDGTRDMAPLAGRYMECLREIDDLRAGVPQEGTPLDELKRRRASRSAAAAS